MKLSKGIIAIIVVVVILLIGYMWGKSGYNNMVEKEVAVESQWAQVQNAYKRRADLIPNLVSTVKGYASHEQETLTAVVEARAKATQMNINADDLTPEKLKQYQDAQGQLSTALGRLLMVQEQYPDLKANTNFMALQEELTGTENRISTERGKFNETVKDYNTTIRTFPRNIFAGIFGFERKAFFEAGEAAQEAPNVGELFN